MWRPFKQCICASSKSGKSKKKRKSKKISSMSSEDISTMASSSCDRVSGYEKDSRQQPWPGGAHRVKKIEMTDVLNSQGDQSQCKKSEQSMEMYLPNDIIQFCLMKLKNVIDSQKKNAASFDDDVRNEAIQVTRNKGSRAEMEVLNGILAALYQKHTDADPHLGLYLQSPEGKAWLGGSKQGSDLCVQVSWPVLLAVRNRCQHQLLVYGGYITAAHSQVVVLPVFEEGSASSDEHHKYKDWTPECKQILEEALMSSTLASYADILNQQPPFSLMLKSSRPSPSRYVTFLHVPDPAAGKFKDYLNTAVKKAIHDAVDLHPDIQNLCIALPLMLETMKKGWKIILTAVIEALNDLQENTKVTLKLYTGLEASEPLVKDMEDILKTKGWTRPSRGLEGPRIQVEMGDILDSRILELTEVMVNSTDPGLKHTNGCVSKAVLEKAGRNLSKECKNNYPKGLNDDCIVAVTDSHGLDPVKKIFHIALPLTDWNMQEEARESLLEELRGRVISCLTLASANGFRSITFPALGTGKLQYPAEEVAQAMFSASQDFFDSMPHSSVQKVYIVCHPEEKPLVQTFREKKKAYDSLPKNYSSEKGSSSKTAAFSRIHLYGKKTAVEQAAKKIQDRMLFGEDEDGYLLVGADDAVERTEVEKQGAGREGERLTDARLSCQGGEGNTEDLNLWSLSLPLSAYKNTKFEEKLADKNTGLMLKKLQTEFQPAPNKRLWFEQEQFDTVVDFVQRQLLQCGSDTLLQTSHAARETLHPAHKTSHPARKHTKQHWTNIYDECEVLALKSLIGKEFSKMFSENNLHDDKIEIEFRGSSPPEMMLDKIESLRHEELPLSKEECLKLGSPSDTRTEDVEAFIYPKPDERKVIVFSLEYSALTKAKHIINVRLGKVKVTSRGNRKFESDHREGPRIQAPQPPVPSGYVSANSASGYGTVHSDFITNSGLKVSVYKMDITKLPVDAIVNAANEYLQHGGGVAFAIARAADFQLESECSQYIREHGTLKVAQVAVTTGGRLPCKKVLHAVGPRWSDYKDKTACQRDLSDTIFNCLKTAHEHGFKSLAVSSISSAIFGVPQDLCAECYLRAVQQFEDQFGGTDSLAQVHFVDVSDTMVNTIQKTFTQKWNTRLTYPSTQPMYDSSAHERPGMEAPGKQKSVPFSRSHSAPVDNPEAAGRMSKKAFHVHIKGLDVFFHQQQVSSMKTDSIVLWQEDGKLFEHADSHLIISREGLEFLHTTVPQLKKELQQCSTVSHWQNFQLFICRKILTGAVDVPDLLHVLNKVDAEKVSSVAIPMFQQGPGSNKPAQGFGESLQKALSEYLKQPQRRVKEIHVIGSDRGNIEAAEEAFEHREHAILEDAKRPSENQRATRSFSQQQEKSRVCGICDRDYKDPWTLTKCQHVFCKTCLEKQFTTGSRRVCPECHTSYDIIGSYPLKGEMKMKRESTSLPGFSSVHTLVMEYSFPKRKQTAEDPAPGCSLEGLKGSAYLPDTEEGRRVLMLLKNAFDKGLLFTMGYHSSSKNLYTIGYSDIPLKTSKKFDSKSRFAYPDPDYLSWVQGKLLEYGISAKDFTSKQKNFVVHPEDCFPHFVGSKFDFSSYFSCGETNV